MELMYCTRGGNSCSAVVGITVIAFIRISDEPSVRFHIIDGDAV
jgi:ribosomal protein S12